MMSVFYWNYGTDSSDTSTLDRAIGSSCATKDKIETGIRSIKPVFLCGILDLNQLQGSLCYDEWLLAKLLILIQDVTPRFIE